MKKLEFTPFESRCLHQSFYLQYPLFGFMQLRLQTWAPFIIHVSINGRECLAHQLQQAGVDYQKRRSGTLTDKGRIIIITATLAAQNANTKRLVELAV